MGYYSNVALLLYKEDYDKLLEQAKDLLDKNLCSLITRDPIVFKQGDNLYSYVNTNCIKWYDGDEEVDLVEQFIEDKPHTFVVIGEFDRDVYIENFYPEDRGEIDYTFYENLYVERKIVCYFRPDQIVDCEEE